MKKLLLFSFLAIQFLYGFSQSESGIKEQKDKSVHFLNSPKSLFKWKDVSLDLKAIDPDKGYFGIDYKVNFIRTLGTLGKTKDEEALYPKNINFGVGSNGYVTVIGEKNKVNSIVNEVKFEGFPIYRIKPATVVSNDSWENYMDDEDVDPVNDPLIVKSQQLARQFSSPLWVFFNVHAKHETTQDFKNYDFAFGSQLSFSTSFLNKLIDLPFRLLRVGPNNNPRQLDLSIGYDYVTQIKKTALKALNDGNSMSRLNLKGEWETGILTGKDRFVFLFDAYHDLNATQMTKDAGKDWNTFFMAKIEHLMSYNPKTKTLSKISIKYVKGELPPDFTKGYVLGAGFSLEF